MCYNTKPTLDHQPSRERLKIMAHHSSVSTREEASTTRHETSTRKETSTPSRETREKTSRRRNEKSDNSRRAGGDACAPSSDSSVNSDPSLKSHSIDASLKRRARLLISNSSIPRQTRSLIRYALEIKDPYLAQVVRRVEAGEMTIEWLYIE